MTHAPETQMLIAGGGPIGMTAAIELTRRGIACRIVDPLVEPLQYAKAVGVQPRTLEVFEGMGVLRRILDAALLMRGQIVFVNGERVAQLDMTLPDDVPFGFIAIPQYATEAILREELAMHGVAVQRGVRVSGFEQDADGVTATLVGDAGEQPVRAAYLVGADGAHSAVRKGLGLTFEGAAFEEQYMLGDVEVDWSMPRGYGIRREAQLLINYAGSPIVTRATGPATSGPDGAGARAPDATGLTRDAVTGPLRLFSLLGRREHTTLLYAPDGPVDGAMYERAAAAAVSAAHGRMDVYLIAAPGADVTATELPLIRDTAGDFARAYAPAGPSAYVVRPDGYLGLAGSAVDPEQLVAHLDATFARSDGRVSG
jgi:FAD binding domain